VPATNFAVVYGVLGGIAASGLSTALHMLKGWVRKQREREMPDDALSQPSIE
jgi:hypothetical protein